MGIGLGAGLTRRSLLIAASVALMMGAAPVAAQDVSGELVLLN
jgi:hypothetical protein